MADSSLINRFMGQGHGIETAREVMTRMTCGIEALLTSKEASQVLKIHPKVLERMAKRGEVPALKVGKFWRYRAIDFVSHGCRAGLTS
jgi:excisionase family DNA binding protein